ncbi:MFS general substrate transporter [Cucurbitaria berberidis CBS 394.84]|uniref:MFS general substrate transporter n=1 Tax=Cucurbitaria berberidis CBS 394.84 TaxID=1168544 RepID=A0A9P4LBV7_9PLEO|nr:MFS general substrate transporter [Cucurbitaria berberidis CBS 394.84]KAF1849023.1 MFS general substrate transporter [Cucurbitaria berberidis CBS 394.84]
MNIFNNHTRDEEVVSDAEKGDINEENTGSEYELEGRLPATKIRSSEGIPSIREQDMSDATPQQKVNATDWNGINDPDNPHNWPMSQRVYHTVIPSLFGFAVTFGTSVYTPALADIMHEFKVSRTIALLGLAIYTLGIGVGPIITAPLSEGHGRKVVYMISSPIFMLFTMGAGLSNTFAGFCVCRFFAGLSGSPALAVGAGTNADLFPPQQRAVAASLFLMAPFAGPSLGPIVGGFVAQYKGWRWTQWCMLFITLVIFIGALPMKETYKPIILKKRAKMLGYHIKPSAEGPSLKRTIILKYARPMHMLFTEPTVFFFSLYTSFAFGVLFLFFAAFPYIFSRPPYSMTVSQIGLTFIAIGIGVLLGGITCVIIDRKYYQKKHQEALSEGRSHADPEHRLYSAMIGSWGIFIGLFWFGWCAEKGVHWAATLLGAIPFAWGNLCLFTSAVLYLVDVYGPLNGSSAMAANGVSRYGLGAVFPLFTFQMYETLGIGWATSLLGFLSLVMIPIPYLFFKRGTAIRARSKYPVAT